MLTRRRVLGYSALLAQRRLLPSAAAQTNNPVRLAIIGNTYHYGSDLQIIADRFLVGYPHEGDWHMPRVKVVSMYVESRGGATGRQRGQGSSQRVAAMQAPDTGPLADLSPGRSKEFGFRLFRNIPETLRCGGDGLAVDAVLSVVQQEDYPTHRKG